MMTKVRRMAGEFQGQFNQAIREANLEDVKKDFDELRQSASILKRRPQPGQTSPRPRSPERSAGVGHGRRGSPSPTPSAMIDPALTSRRRFRRPSRRRRRAEAEADADADSLGLRDSPSFRPPIMSQDEIEASRAPLLEH